MNNRKEYFEIWFKSIQGSTNKKIKVPLRIEWMSCGCERERENEIDVNNAWYIKIEKGKYIHRECKKRAYLVKYGINYFFILQNLSRFSNVRF